MSVSFSRQAAAIRADFGADGDGVLVTARQSGLLDETLKTLWFGEKNAATQWNESVALVATGGYGRSEIFPQSDIDVLFCSEKPLDPASKEQVRRITQALWDLGLRASPVTRTIAECERFSPENPEFALALLNRRFVVGNRGTFTKLNDRVQAKLFSRDLKALNFGLLALTRERHRKYGDTIFHLEPNIKEVPGGLRDANVCEWIQLLHPQNEKPGADFEQAREFLFALRCFLHYRHERDDNVLDWQAQDAAAELSIGLPSSRATGGDASAWMRRYFRHARVIDQAAKRAFETVGQTLVLRKTSRRGKLPEAVGFSVQNGKISVDAQSVPDPAADPETVLGGFRTMALTGLPLDVWSEQRISLALPLLASHLDEWPAMWNALSAILVAPHAGVTLRSMHKLGVLELVLPEFHGIDALVIRDAYHRYTVDEHTFVLIDVLHELEEMPAVEAPEWRQRFGAIARELHHRAALYLAALLHDTGKGRANENHATESVRVANAVLARLDVDSFDAELVVQLIDTHLEMSSALRRDIFDTDTLRNLTNKVQSHELLRMLTIFTYADIRAVHPDALTPWKAENLWRLFMTASNQLDRDVDEERIHARGQDERIARILEMAPHQKAELELFLEGFPERYLGTKPKEVIASHFAMTKHFPEEPFQIAFVYHPSMSEITVVTRDKPRLFSDVAGALAAKGMNVVSAEAFANASGVVVDTFRFTDTYQTLELNLSERDVFGATIRDMLSGRISLERMLKGRRSQRRRAPKLMVATSVTFDETASTHSTLMQVVAQDSSGLLRTIGEVLSGGGYNVEVALIDTEGETAIDVFYLTSAGLRLTREQQAALAVSLREAIETNAAG